MIIELYTDGSSYLNGEVKKSSAGFVIYTYERLIAQGGEYFPTGTNNKGEISAILLALKAADTCVSKMNLSLLNDPDDILFRVIGDSLISIEGCRTWIYDWVKKSKNGALISSSGEEVKNGEIFKEIYNDFLKPKRYKFEFLHVNSHKLDVEPFIKMRKDIFTYFYRRSRKLDVEELPKKIFETKVFRQAKKSFFEKNKKKIDDLELLRLLMHNKEADELASYYLVSNMSKDIKGRDKHGKKEKGKEISK